MLLSGARRVPRRKAQIQSNTSTTGTWNYLVALTTWIWKYIATLISGNKRKRDVQRVEEEEEKLPQIKKSRHLNTIVEEDERKDVYVFEEKIEKEKEKEKEYYRESAPSLAQVISRFGISVNGRNVSKMHFAELYECAMILSKENPQLRNEIQNYESKDCENLRKIVYNLALKNKYH
jgi:hypothetical protein